MKKIIVVCLYLMISCISFAQIQRTVVKQQKDSTEIQPVKKNDSKKEMFKEMDLSKEQKVKLKEINQSMKASKEAIENDTALSEPEKKAKLKALKKDQAVKIQAILTDEQKVKYRELREKNRKG